MRSLKLFLTTFIFIAIALTASAQTKSENFKVAGVCGMCKKKIEKAAKDAGATTATWSTETKVLSVSYNNSSSSKAKIQKAIAGVGYDTPEVKATEEAYSSLHGCCKYERTGSEPAEHKCANDEKCDHTSCGKKS